MNRNISLERLINELKSEHSTLLTNILSAYLPPVIILIGTVTNLFSLIIFLKLTQFKFSLKLTRSFKFLNIFYLNFNLSTSNKLNTSNSNKLNFNNKKQRSGLVAIYFYLSLLSLTDLGVIYFGLLNDWISELTVLTFKNSSKICCKLFTFLAFIFSHLSSSLIVITCLLRLIDIYSPIKAARLTNKNSFKKTVFSLIVFYSILNMHLFWNMNLVELESGIPENFLNELNSDLFIPVLNEIEHNKAYDCQFVAGEYLKIAWPIIDKLIYCLIPFFIITIVNILIIINISKTQKYKNGFYLHKLKTEDSEQDELPSFKNSNISLTYHYVLDRNNKHSHTSLGSNLNRFFYRKESNKLLSKKITFMLLWVSFMFLILTLPVVILYVLLDKIKIIIDNSSDPERHFQWLSIAQKITSLLMYLNHSINFFIYFASSARFRQKFKNMFSKNENKSCQKNKQAQNIRFQGANANEIFFLRKKSSIYG
ncbi:unnamed protein product [Brachionus calyciflorus]|uniref:G-protein coupled receptors family 1 profile domain-containing protein n=1 Tax=Brachionus calyciflorus TaxID=104777 RepID=A0A814HCL6_9BILA|nr:unnamed protein product [Brachionus calyciflorus]